MNVVQNMNAAKAYRKLKEVEEKKLSNRITLLKLELQKSLHKIEETRKRTDDILNHRSKINERNKQKEEELMRRQREIEAAQMINHNIRSRMSDYRQVRRSFVRIVLVQLGACQTKGPFSGVFIRMTVLMLAIICPPRCPSQNSASSFFVPRLFYFVICDPLCHCLRLSFQANLASLQMAKAEEARKVMIEHMNNKRLIQEQRKLELLRAVELRKLIQAQMMEGRLSREYVLEKKKDEARQHFNAKVQEEAEQTREFEKKVASMEAEEVKLIMMLEQAQEEQKKAYAELESALLQAKQQEKLQKVLDERQAREIHGKGADV